MPHALLRPRLRLILQKNHKNHRQSLRREDNHVTGHTRLGANRRSTSHHIFGHNRRHHRRQMAEEGGDRKTGRSLRRRSELLQPLPPGDPAEGPRQSGRHAGVPHARRARFGSHTGLQCRRSRRRRLEPGAPDDRPGLYRGRQARRRARRHAGRHRARRIRLHGHRAGLRVPARHLHQALSGQLEGVAHPCGVGPDARRQGAL